MVLQNTIVKLGYLVVLYRNQFLLGLDVECQSEYPILEYIHRSDKVEFSCTLPSSSKQAEGFVKN